MNVQQKTPPPQRKRKKKKKKKKKIKETTHKKKTKNHTGKQRARCENKRFCFVVNVALNTCVLCVPIVHYAWRHLMYIYIIYVNLITTGTEILIPMSPC